MLVQHGFFVIHREMGKCVCLWETVVYNMKQVGKSGKKNL